MRLVIPKDKICKLHLSEVGQERQMSHNVGHVRPAKFQILHMKRMGYNLDIMRQTAVFIQIMVEFFSFFNCTEVSRISLRKHTYSNILKILPPKMKIFR